MTTQRRAEVLAANRVRSIRRYEDENQPPGDAGSSAFGGKVSKLKGMFQTYQDPEISKPPLSIKPTMTRPSGGSGFAGHHSPEVKRKRVPDATENEEAMKPQHTTQPDPESQNIDPNKFMETVNHVQRFNYTRMMFAKMEQKTTGAGGDKLKPIQRKVSPNRSALSPSPVRSPTSSTPPSAGHSPEAARHLQQAGHPLDVARKPRASSDPAEMEIVANQSAPPVELAKPPKGRSKSTSSTPHISQNDPRSKSTPDLAAGSSEWTREEGIPSFRSRMQMFEKGGGKGPEPKKDTPKAAPNRFLRSSEAPPAERPPSLPSSSPPPTQNNRYAKPNRFEDQAPETAAAPNRSDSTVAYRNAVNSNVSYRGGSSGQENGVHIPLRRRREQEEKEKRLSKEDMEESIETNQKYWEQRAKDKKERRERHSSEDEAQVSEREMKKMEKRLSKEDIQASLEAVEKYWESGSYTEKEAHALSPPGHYPPPPYRAPLNTSGDSSSSAASSASPTKNSKPDLYFGTEDKWSGEYKPTPQPRNSRPDDINEVSFPGARFGGTSFQKDFNQSPRYEEEVTSPTESVGSTTYVTLENDVVEESTSDGSPASYPMQMSDMQMSSSSYGYDSQDPVLNGSSPTSDRLGLGTPPEPVYKQRSPGQESSEDMNDQDQILSNS